MIAHHGVPWWNILPHGEVLWVYSRGAIRRAGANADLFWRPVPGLAFPSSRVLFVPLMRDFCLVFCPPWAGFRFSLVTLRVTLGCSRSLFLAAFGRVSPISMSKSPVSVVALAACGPAGMRVTRFHVGAGLGIISQPIWP